MPNSRKRGKRHSRLGFKERRNSFTGAEGSSTADIGVRALPEGTFSLSEWLALGDESVTPAGGTENSSLVSLSSSLACEGVDDIMEEELDEKVAGDQVNCG